ncbi:MAG: asparagine synthase [Rhodoferax sp.]|nr:asparagine synthase [Rhodoferax sp.]
MTSSQPMIQDHTTLCLGKPTLAVGNAATGDCAAVLARWQQDAATMGLEAATEALRGDFALGVTVPDGGGLLAVDRFAMRTMCWRFDNGKLRFAERADELCDANANIDPQAIFDYLFFHAIPSPRTIFRGVYRLPPGHCLSIEQGRPVVRPYWRPKFEASKDASFDMLRDEFRRLMLDAVRTQLDGSKPACFLSGGTDSSTITGMAAQALGQQRVATYSIGFDAAGYDEMAYARLAAKRYRTEHHEYYVTPADLVSGIPLVAAAYDQPFGNSSALPAYYCALMARNDGVSRILAGDGGDELFGGNSRYAKQQVFELYQRVPSALRRGLLEPLLGQPGAQRLPFVRKAASYIEQARLAMPARLSLYNLVLRLGVDRVLTPAMVAQFDQSAPLRHQQESWDAANADDILNRELAFDWRYTLGEIDIPKVRGTATLAGLSVGYPMLDQRLVEFSMRLPGDYKLRGKQLRWFFKEALKGFLPDEIITKEKHGFGLPFGLWASRDSALRQLSRSSLERLVDRGMVRGDFVNELLDRLLPEHPGYYGEMVWILMMLSQWLDAKAPTTRL